MMTNPQEIHSDGLSNLVLSRFHRLKNELPNPSIVYSKVYGHAHSLQKLPFNEKTSTSESLADDLSAPLKEAFNNLYGTTPQSDQRKNRSNNLRSKFSE